MILTGTVKILLAFAALCATTLALSGALGEKTLFLLYLELLVFVAFLAMYIKEQKTARTATLSHKLKEEVLLDTPARHFEGETDDTVDKARIPWGEKGRLLLTPARVLYRPDGQSPGFSVLRNEIVLATRGIVTRDGRRVQTGFSGILVIKTTGASRKFFVEDIDDWMMQLHK
ncbi:MAG: hypothetical protein V1708_01355 [Candidatus Micrarchaeota archaeon]